VVHRLMSYKVLSKPQLNIVGVSRVVHSRLLHDTGRSNLDGEVVTCDDHCQSMPLPTHILWGRLPRPRPDLYMSASSTVPVHFGLGKDYFAACIKLFLYLLYLPIQGLHT